jgi:hypothetical protein
MPTKAVKEFSDIWFMTSLHNGKLIIGTCMLELCESNIGEPV